MKSFDRSRIAILVVEDEPLLLMDALDMVEDAGFTALGASNADEALLLLETHDDIRVLFTDVDMPGSMDGLKLAHAVRNRWPPITIIVASGHVRVRPDQLPENGLFFSKPYPPASVLEALEAIAERYADSYRRAAKGRRELRRAPVRSLGRGTPVGRRNRGTTNMADDGKPRSEGETTREKTEGLKAARLQAERDRDARIDRASRKSAARRKILAGPDGEGTGR